MKKIQQLLPTFNKVKYKIYKIQPNFQFFHQIFKKDRIFYLRKVQSTSFSVINTHGIPCSRKYNLTSTFWIKKEHISYLHYMPEQVQVI